MILSRSRRLFAVLAATLLTAAGLLISPAPALAAITTYVSVKKPDWATSVKVLDMREYSKDNYGRAQLWALRKTGEVRNQRWTITRVGSDEYGQGIYTLRNSLSQKCLDQPGGGGNGTPVVQMTCDKNSISQQWVFEDIFGDGTAWQPLSNNSSGLCLDVTDVSYTDGALLQVWHCVGDWNQRWNIS